MLGCSRLGRQRIAISAEERGFRLTCAMSIWRGWNTVSAAHAIASLYADDLEAAIGIAAGSGCDTDTVASMVGAMLGAVHGYAALPKRWIDGLHERELLEQWPERMESMARRALALPQPFVMSP
jgi:ADP-ribosylglycohydrolase